ncbi:four helix bundle protein [candidate division WOR-3 bacterium]|nr:four helix bundle protein [candidate division WOR-3 bacterium]
MTKFERTKQFDLEDRTFQFARRVIDFAGTLPESISNREIIRQLVRSAGSVGANYIEANESLSRKDFLMRVKICRKESKECRYWLLLTRLGSDKDDKERTLLVQEATELMKIFGSIVEKSR